MMATRFCADGVTGQGFRFALLGGVVLLSACAPMALTAVGVGSAAGVQHTMGGITYRTFTVPLPQVRGAAVAGLNRMASRSIHATNPNRAR
jgi:hypothetical protein